MAVALAVLLFMVGAGMCATSGSRVAAWLALGAAFVWPFVNRPLEGPVLFVIGHGHGLTASDLLAPAGVLLSLLAITRRLRGPQEKAVDEGASSGVEVPACSAAQSG